MSLQTTNTKKEKQNMREHFTARNGWTALALGVAAFEIACPKGETLSEGVDRVLERPLGKYAALGGIALTALHLANALPERLDPFHYALFWKDRDGATEA